MDTVFRVISLILTVAVPIGVIYFFVKIYSYLKSMNATLEKILSNMDSETPGR